LERPLQCGDDMKRNRRLVILAAALGIAACRDSQPSTPSVAPAPALAARAAAPQQVARPVNTQDYVPAEFKSGKARWKDTGVYLDGKPVGFLTFGELPIALQPTWIKDKVSQNKPPGSNIPAWRWAQQRFYKFDDYLKAIGIDPKSIVQIHVYGPKETDTIIATGKDLASPLGQQFMFHFGADVSGKAIPQVPLGFGNGRTPDKIAAVMIYVKKKPPVLVAQEGFYLDGQPVEGVPYYGEPARGGVRVYLDDKLAMIIKRQDLDDKEAVKDAKGDGHWSLYDMLHKHGVDTSKVVEAWAIQNDRRTNKFGADELAGLRFTATAQAKGVVVLGDGQVPANVIALHSHKLTDAELPHILPEEE
jgi:hypothetical protein